MMREFSLCEKKEAFTEKKKRIVQLQSTYIFASAEKIDIIVNT